MSKGKYERKRKNAIEKAQQKAEQVRLSHDVVIAAEHEPKNPNPTSPHSDKKEKKNMGLREVAKRSSSTDWILAFFTGGLVVLGFFQYKTMASQLFVMKNDQRAWLDVRRNPTDVSIETGDVMQYPLKVFNTGKTPARNVEASMQIQFLKADDAVDFSCIERKSNCLADGDVWGTFSPNVDNPISATRYGADGKNILVTPDEANAWQAERVYVAVVGILNYDDVFGTHHWNKFCFWANYPNNGSGTHFNGKSCTQYNSVDTN